MGNSYFGNYGGTFIPETLSFALEELENLYRQIKDDSSFKEDLKNLWNKLQKIGMLMIMKLEYILKI